MASVALFLVGKKYIYRERSSIISFHVIILIFVYTQTLNSFYLTLHQDSQNAKAWPELSGHMVQGPTILFLPPCLSVVVVQLSEIGDLGEYLGLRHNCMKCCGTASRSSTPSSLVCCPLTQALVLKRVDYWFSLFIIPSVTLCN